MLEAYMNQIVQIERFNGDGEFGGTWDSPYEIKVYGISDVEYVRDGDKFERIVVNKYYTLENVNTRDKIEGIEVKHSSKHNDIEGDLIYVEVIV